MTSQDYYPFVSRCDLESQCPLSAPIFSKTLLIHSKILIPIKFPVHDEILSLINLDFQTKIIYALNVKKTGPNQPRNHEPAFNSVRYSYINWNIKNRLINHQLGQFNREPVKFTYENDTKHKNISPKSSSHTWPPWSPSQGKFSWILKNDLPEIHLPSSDENTTATLSVTC